MKKKLISLLLAASMLLSSGVVALAAEGEETETRAIVPNMQFTGTTINLSLKDAITRMQTEGLRAQTADINKQSDAAIAAGYSESARTISNLLNKYNDENVSDNSASVQLQAALDSAGANTVNQRIVKLRRDFATEYLEKNNQAELNAIEADTVTIYYSVLLAQDQLQSAQDNLQIQKDILANTNKKFELGTVAKIDVLSAENGVVNAEKEVLSATNALTDAKMSFNMLLGYPLMQNVTFTDNLKELEAPTVSLQAAVNNALENRMEIPGTELALEVNQILIENLGLTISKASSTYKNQQIAVLTAEQNKVNMPTVIEQDIRSKYVDMQTKKTELDTAKANLELAKEAYRISSISYDAGMNTLVDVQEAQYKVFLASQGVSLATLNYDMAVYAFNYAQGVGTDRIPL